VTAHRLLLGVVVDPAGSASPDEIADQVAAAESYGFSFALFDDGPAAPAGLWSLDPIETAAFASAHTAAIGLIATAAATHAEPYHLSNRFSSVDWGSSGRAGWLVTIDTSADRARAYSAPPPQPGTARREADAVVDAARLLWDSWEDGALIADSATGRFLDNEKIHYIDASGEFFSVRGPALMPRPPQGQVPVLARAQDHVAGADVIIVTAAAEAGLPAGTGGLEAATSDLARAAGQARAAGAGRVFAELEVQALDGPGASQELEAAVRRLAGAADGVLLRPRTAATLDALGRGVLPALAADGTLVPPRPGQTLRDQLGLPRPPSRYAARTADIPGAHA
jgi:alkanesulfonate monooxygenase SsuD/methylene tetrahydromethanopterin reductase-like flavin-dependent oxidoreductase (luciferase family)